MCRRKNGRGCLSRHRRRRQVKETRLVSRWRRERRVVREYVTWIPCNVFAKCRKYKRTRLRHPRETVVYINSSRLLSPDSACGLVLCVHAGCLSLSPFPSPSTWCVRVSIFDGGVSEHLPTKCDQASRMLKIPVWSTCRATSVMPSGCGLAQRSSASDCFVHRESVRKYFPPGSAPRRNSIPLYADNNICAIVLNKVFPIFTWREIALEW